MKRQSAIIVGAGIGGLATAIQLAKNGFRVTVYEKGRNPGGRCQRIVRDGYLFDTGPTMYIFPELYQRFFTSIGEKVEDHLTLLKTDPTYKLTFADDSVLTITADKSAFLEQMEAIEQGSSDRFTDFLALAKRYYELTVNTVLTQSFDRFSDSFRVNFYSLITSRAISNHMKVVGKYFRDPKLQAAFTFQDSYLSLHPFETQAIYSSFAYTELTHGSYLPNGGMYAVIEALESIAKKVGVTIAYSHEVEAILTEGSTATGVHLVNGKTDRAAVVVVNAEVPYAYTHLLPYSKMAQTLTEKKYSCSAIVFHWAMKKQYSYFHTHNLFFSQSYKEGFDQVLKTNSPPLEPHFYIQAPCRTDPSRAPHRCDTLSVMVPINHLNKSVTLDWSCYIESVRSYVISRLKKLGMSDFEEQILFEETYTPHDWAHYLNLPFGAIYGLDHTLLQLGPFRPKRQHGKYKNLYFVGASTHPGSGLPTVLSSAQFTSQAILRRWG